MSESAAAAGISSAFAGGEKTVAEAPLLAVGGGSTLTHSDAEVARGAARDAAEEDRPMIATGGVRLKVNAEGKFIIVSAATGEEEAVDPCAVLISAPWAPSPSGSVNPRGVEGAVATHFPVVTMAEGDATAGGGGGGGAAGDADAIRRLAQQLSLGQAGEGSPIRGQSRASSSSSLSLSSSSSLGGGGHSRRRGRRQCAADAIPLDLADIDRALAAQEDDDDELSGDRGVVLSTSPHHDYDVGDDLHGDYPPYPFYAASSAAMASPLLSLSGGGHEMMHPALRDVLQGRGDAAGDVGLRHPGLGPLPSGASIQYSSPFSAAGARPSVAGRVWINGGGGDVGAGLELSNAFPSCGASSRPPRAEGCGWEGSDSEMSEAAECRLSAARSDGAATSARDVPLPLETPPPDANVHHCRVEQEVASLKCILGGLEAQGHVAVHPTGRGGADAVAGGVDVPAARARVATIHSELRSLHQRLVEASAAKHARERGGGVAVPQQVNHSAPAADGATASPRAAGSPTHYLPRQAAKLREQQRLRDEARLRLYQRRSWMAFGISTVIMGVVLVLYYYTTVYFYTGEGPWVLRPYFDTLEELSALFEDTAYGDVLGDRRRLREFRAEVYTSRYGGQEIVYSNRDDQREQTQQQHAMPPNLAKLYAELTADERRQYDEMFKFLHNDDANRDSNGRPPFSLSMGLGGTHDRGGAGDGGYPYGKRPRKGAGDASAITTGARSAARTGRLHRPSDATYSVGSTLSSIAHSAYATIVGAGGPSPAEMQRRAIADGGYWAWRMEQHGKHAEAFGRAVAERRDEMRCTSFNVTGTAANDDNDGGHADDGDDTPLMPSSACYWPLDEGFLPTAPGSGSGSALSAFTFIPFGEANDPYSFEHYRSEGRAKGQ